MEKKRILSIDIFRGFTIFMMVFVNDVAGVKEIPAWMKHAATGADTMTFVDVVFPAFLFIVGMAIPFAVANRKKKGESSWEIWKHTLIRTAGLLILGVFMVNSEEMNREANLISASWWNALLYISAILIWNQYPKTEGNKKYLFWGLKIVGVIVLLILSQLYRKGPVTELTGMTTSWWGILGLIGWAYLIAMVIREIFGTNLIGLVGIIGIFTLAVLGLKSEGLKLPEVLSWLTWWKGHLAHATLTVAGMVIGFLFKDTSRSSAEKIRWTLIAGLFFVIAGFFVRPFFGISKNLATPAWVMYCSAICCFVFAAIYWLVDIKEIKSWASFLKPAGTNPLLTYILPSLFYAIAGYAFAPAFLAAGIPGIVKSIMFSLFILGLAALLTRMKVRLHL